MIARLITMPEAPPRACRKRPAINCGSDCAAMHPTLAATISVKPASKDLVAIQASVEHTKGRDMMSWLSLDPEKLSGRLLEYPTRGNIPTKVSEQLIVELYSK